LEVCLFQLSQVIADSEKSVSERVYYIFIFDSVMFTGILVYTIYPFIWFITERAQFTNFFVCARQEKVCSL